MYRITVVDEQGGIAAQIKRMSIWKKHDDFLLTEAIGQEQNVLKQLERFGTDIVCIPTYQRPVSEIALIEELKRSRMSVRFMLISENRDYEQVREGFLSGAFDYLVRPFTEEQLDQAINRIYENVVSTEILFNITPKIDVLIENLFSEDGADVQFICADLIDTLYKDLHGDALNAQMAAEKTKGRVYDELIRRKPWLEKFLYAKKYTYQIGFKKKLKEEIVREWIHDFTRVGQVIAKYHMIDHKLVYPIGKYMVVHVEEKLSLENVANAVFLNKNYVSHIFKKYVGMSFVDFVNEVKVDRAKILLKDRNKKIHEIAAQLQYADAEYFSKIFKQKTGISPSEYRNFLKT